MIQRLGKRVNQWLISGFLMPSWKLISPLYGGILLIMPQPDKGGNIQVFFDVLWMAWRDYWMPIVFLWLTMSLRKRGIKLLKGLLLIWWRNKMKTALFIGHIRRMVMLRREEIGILMVLLNWILRWLLDSWWRCLNIPERLNIKKLQSKLLISLIMNCIWN